MAVEIKTYITERLARLTHLPKDHPEKKFMEELLLTVDDYLTKDREEISGLYPFPSELIEKAVNRSEEFFSQKMPEIPGKIYDEFAIRIRNLEKQGFLGFDVVILPDMELTPVAEIPNWKTRPESQFWKKLMAKTIPEDAASLRRGIYLVDGRDKPNYENGNQMYKDDYLAPLMQKLRGDGKVENYPVPLGSRFCVSPVEIEKVIIPEIAQLIGTKGLRYKRFIEFNIIGNMMHPEWGKTNTWEWCTDEYLASHHLICGNSDNGGLGEVKIDFSIDAQPDDIGFNPLVEILF